MRHQIGADLSQQNVQSEIDPGVHRTHHAETENPHDQCADSDDPCKIG